MGPVAPCSRRRSFASAVPSARGARFVAYMLSFYCPWNEPCPRAGCQIDVCSTVICARGSVLEEHPIADRIPMPIPAHADPAAPAKYGREVRATAYRTRAEIQRRRILERVPHVTQHTHIARPIFKSRLMTALLTLLSSTSAHIRAPDLAPLAPCHAWASCSGTTLCRPIRASGAIYKEAASLTSAVRLASIAAATSGASDTPPTRL